MTRPLPGAVPSPNIWRHTETYELENRSLDSCGLLDDAMRELGDWTDLDVLDLGCGTGFHLPRFAADARSVVGVEPHPDLARLAARRTSRWGNVRVLTGTAQRIPLPAASVDVVTARWAYFFGPGCEPGLVELERVVRPGGIGLVVDVDASQSTFGSWFRLGYPTIVPAEVERFWSLHGWQRRGLVLELATDTRSEFESIVRIEFDDAVAARVLASHDETSVDYAVNLWWKRF